ncbi:hypothetical protein KJ756_01940 [Patescibacteria group bacterium]|nr:hypothetical protein [Patescibacteria group bacterium]MBU4030897.1 hypothetical protein [Patescibacteria group bacterium]MBU4082384.1 hypothetical protein [Patescibacteria group bacterium]MCG2808804.1 hypothetical protein [Candidatus Portnoybacteria bacterium]
MSDEIKECPDPRCRRGYIFCEGMHVVCMTCKGVGEGTEEFFKKNKEEAEKLRREIFADACAS